MQRSRWLLGVLAVSLATSVPAMAQSPEDNDSKDWDLTAVPELTSSGAVTPEMWFYIQEYNRHKSPQEAVRRKAELRSAQRQQRLESQRWFGFSNLRPLASPVPFYGTYSPMWTGGGWNPYEWRGVGQPYVTYHTARRDR